MTHFRKPGIQLLLYSRALASLHPNFNELA